MTTFNTTLYNDQSGGKVPLATPAGDAKNVKRAFGSVVVPNTLALNDLINFLQLPPGAKIVDTFLMSDDLDSNGTPLITVSVGDADGAATIFNASAIAQTGGIDRNPVHTCIDKQYLVKTTLQGKVTAVAATKAQGTIGLCVLFTLDGLPTS